MTDFQAFLQRATVELGIGPIQAESAVGGLLRFVTQQLDRVDTEILLDALSGSRETLVDPLDNPQDLSYLGNFGPDTSPAIVGRLGLLEVIKSADLDTSTAMALMEIFLGVVRSQTTAEFVDRLVACVAELRASQAGAAEAI